MSDGAIDPIEPPHVPVPTETLVQERATQQQLLWFDGVLLLPIGATINLDNVPNHPQVPLDPERFPTGHADAVVVGVNLWGTVGTGRCVVLEVELRSTGGTVSLGAEAPGITEEVAVVAEAERITNIEA